MIKIKLVLCLLIAISTLQCGTSDTRINGLAEDYVHLILEIGRYDDLYIDAYFGPEEWLPEPIPDSIDFDFPSGELLARVDSLILRLQDIKISRLSDLDKMRLRNLEWHLGGAKTKIEIEGGKSLTFDEESLAFFGLTYSYKGDNHYQNLIKKLDSLLPGEGDIPKRYLEYKERFSVKPEDVEMLFMDALQVARDLTLENIELPENENFEVEYISDVSWGGYCEYKGNSKSHLTINTDYYYVDYSLGLAAHEAYPGHHVRGCLLDNNLIKKYGWIELSVFPLYSPLSVLDEGCAELSTEMIMNASERIGYLKKAMRMVELDTLEAERFLSIQEIRKDIAGSSTESIRLYLDGKIDRDSTISRLINLSLQSHPEESIEFGEEFRSYKITYVIGKDLIKNILGEDNIGTAEGWRRLVRIHSDPVSILDSLIYQNR